VIQLLPINYTLNFSPFSPISCFALNPLYLSLSVLEVSFGESSSSMAELLTKLRALNETERVQWVQVRDLKMEWLWKYFLLPEQQKILRSSQFCEFRNEHRYWLEGFSRFCVLKKKNEWVHWRDWISEELQMPDDEKELEFHIFLQFLCFSQMKKVKQHALEKKVFLKGDLPFLVSSDSADVWMFRDYFDLDYSAGAPPDMYNEDGQDWGLPLYCWENMEKDGYIWWKKRLSVAREFYDLYRLDHIVGFFRIWAIGKGKKPAEGTFRPSDPSLWIPQGESLMRMMLESTDMLPIGEDLGTVPIEVKCCLQSLGISGTRVIRWERFWENKNAPMIPLAMYNADSMTTVSTHDSEPLSLWWVQKSDEVKVYCDSKGWEYSTNMELTFEKYFNILYESHHTPSLFHINLLQEYLDLCGFPRICSDPKWDRINVPGVVDDLNWTYRLRSSLEKISNDKHLCSTMRALISPK